MGAWAYIGKETIKLLTYKMYWLESKRFLEVIIPYIEYIEIFHYNLRL